MHCIVFWAAARANGMRSRTGGQVLRLPGAGFPNLARRAEVCYQRKPKTRCLLVRRVNSVLRLPLR